MKMGPGGRASCQAEEADLTLWSMEKLIQQQNPDGLQEGGSRAGRPVRALLENPSMRGSGCTGESGGRGGGRGEGKGHW